MNSRDRPVVPEGEARINSLQVIEGLIRERNELLVLFSRTAGIAPYRAHDAAERNRDLSELCRRLQEYVSSAQTQIYDRVINGTERRRDVKVVTRRFYPRIRQTSRVALAFADRYLDFDPAPSELEADLCLLGEELATRVELEDRIWEELCRLRHGERVLH